MRGALWIGAVATASALGCSPTSNYGVPPVRTRSTGAVRSSTSTGTGSATGGTGGSGGTQLDGGPDAGPPPCSPLDGGVPLGLCPAGSVEVAATIYDGCTFGAVTSLLQVQAFGDPGVVGTNLGCGGVFFCLDAGTQLTMQIAADGYSPTLLETVDAEQSVTGIAVPVICTQEIMGLGMLPGSASSGVPVGVFVRSVTKNPLCADHSGWSFSLTDLAGNPVNATAYYFAGQFPSPGATATFGDGAAFLIVDDTTLTAVRLVATNPSALCGPANAERQLTGEVPLRIGNASMIPFMVDTDAGWPDGGP